LVKIDLKEYFAIVDGEFDDIEMQHKSKEREER
jgi:hypothetical protein